MRPDASTDLSAFFQDEERVTRILQGAVRKALLEHKKLGHSVVVWQDGRVVELAPEQIPVDDDV
ncbi:MAG: hypothetical protein HZA53_03070 [Planctomycetes bacterium]|nr:hypothetical protein [Planctomycetota bacterium]